MLFATRTYIHLNIKMSFRFNFFGEQVVDKSNVEKQEIQWFASEEIKPDKQINNLDDIVKSAKIFTSGDIEIGHVITSSVVENKNLAEFADKTHSDLIIGKYEGGLKIWECTEDFIQYIVNNEDKFKWENAKVLDLGCGAGILGIYAFLNGAQVTFQDYNKEVVEHCTIPNVLLNIEEEERETKIRQCKFYSGDWASFNTSLENSEVYDFILTSETIYNENNYDKLIDLFTRRLNKNGTIYLAAKTYYFGVGGGTRQFEDKIKNSGLLQSEVCWKSSGGIQREILKITHKL